MSPAPTHSANPRPVEPFVGPRPYEPGESALFFGREREIADLCSLIIANRCVLLYSMSGAGKSSLINAGLMPRLAAISPLRPRAVRLAVAADLVARNDIEGLLTSEASGAASPTIWIFDQFEEIFSMKRRRAERRDFFQALGACLENRPTARALFSLREEWLGELNEYSEQFPDDLATRARLESLDREAANEIIVNPFHEAGIAFEPIALEHLLDDLTDSEGRIEPVQLQVVCLELWRAVYSKSTVVTDRHRADHASVGEALRRYYERSLEETSSEAKVRVSTMRAWFDTGLITSSRTRGLSWRGESRTGPVPNQAVDLLEARHLIRAEVRSGERWYEISHDRLVEPILASNSSWRMRRAAVRYGLLVSSLLVLVLALGYVANRFNNLKRAAETARDDAVAKRVVVQIQRSQETDRDDERNLLLLKAAQTLNPREPLLRDGLFRILSNPFLATVIRPGFGAVAAGGWSLKGDKLVLAGKAIEIWTVHPRLARLDSIPCAEECSSVAWSPDGNSIAVGETNGSFSVISVANKTVVLNSRADTRAVTAIAWYPDSRTVATGDLNGGLWLWDVANPEAPPVRIPKARRQIAALACSPAGILAIGSYDWSLAVYDRARNAKRVLGTFRSPVLSVAWSPDGTLASGGWDDTVRVWDVHTGAQLRAWRDNNGRVHAIAWSVDGRQIYAASTDQIVRVLNAEDEKAPAEEIPTQSGSAISLSASQNREHLLVIFEHGSVRLWSKNTAGSPVRLGETKSGIRALAWVAQASAVVAGAEDGSVVVIDPATRLSRTITSPMVPVTSVAALGDSIWAAGSYYDPLRNRAARLRGIVSMWPVDKLRPRRSYSFRSDFTSLFVGSVVLAGTEHGEVLRLDVAERNLKLAQPVMKAGDAPISAVAFTPQQRILAASRTGEIFRSSGAAFEKIALVEDACRTPRVAAFSDDGRQVAISCDRTVAVAHLDPPAPPAVFRINGEVSALAWSGDASRLLYGTTDGSVGMLKPAAPDVMMSSPFPAHSSVVTSLHWTSNGGSFISGATDNSVLFWPSLALFDADPCAFVHRRLEQDEWTAFLGDGVPYRHVCGDAPALN